jgi:hypothetical protein
MEMAARSDHLCRKSEKTNDIPDASPALLERISFGKRTASESFGYCPLPPLANAMHFNK